MAIRIAGVDVINDDRELVLAKLTDINETINDTAVDVFVYDTSKDSDGGAWRHRTQHTSWYAEASSASRDVNTRSTRAEFPSVAVIVAESNKVTIYDGDDPSLPMWMVFDRSTSGFSAWSQTDTQRITGHSTHGVNAIGFKNGTMFVVNSPFDGSANDNNRTAGLFAVNFISDSAQHHGMTGIRTWPLNIQGRNTSAQYSDVVSGGDIVGNAVNDVAMTVLPDAPTDPATGLPVPTIAVATDGGVSVINNDGTVYDSSYTGVLSDVGFWADGTVVYGRGGFTAQALRAEPSAYQIADGFGTYILHGSLSLPNYFPYQSGTLYLPFGDNEVAGGNPSGTTSTNSIPCLGRYVIGSTLPQSMGCVTTSSYTTGWMNGDIKMAALADTTAETLSGSELVTNGIDWTGATGNTPPTGWDKAGSLTQYTITAGGALEIDRNGEAGTNTTQTISTVSGQRYQLSLDYVATSQANTSVLVQVTGTAGLVFETIQELTTHIFDFVADSSSATIGIRPSSAFDQVVEIDNISVRLADFDRSVNGNGLAVNGSITKAAVATGADLVAYSGFDGSNYLEQPYNPDLDFGTGDFSVMLWFKGTDSYGVFATTGITDSTQGFFCVVSGFAGEGKYEFSLGDGAASSTYTSSISTTIDADVWTHVAFVVEDGYVKIYENGSLFYGPTATTRSVAGGGPLTIGYRPWDNAQNYGGSLALFRISATAPTADQIAKIYNDEKVLFQENAKATLTGSSDAVTALAHDPDTDLLHVGTSGGRSVFQGLRRVEEHTGTNSQSLAAISAVDGLVVEGK